MASTATLSITLQWTPPSAAVNSGNVVFSLSANHNAQNVGQIDINPSDAPPTTFVIPFGSIAKAKIAILKNLMSSEISVRLNGAVTDTFVLPANGEFVYAASSTPATVPLTAISIITSAAPAAVESVNYYLVGD